MGVDVSIQVDQALDCEKKKNPVTCWVRGKRAKKPGLATLGSTEETPAGVTTSTRSSPSPLARMLGSEDRAWVVVLLGTPMPHGYSNRRAEVAEKISSKTRACLNSVPSETRLRRLIATPVSLLRPCKFGNICARAAVMFRRYNAPKP